MGSATGRWVSGDDFFDRGRELRILEQRVRDGNHVLLTGQRRMGKTSIVQVVPDVQGRITEVLDVLEHDGYLEVREDLYRFQLHPLRDWWAARFRNHHVPLAARSQDHAGGQAK